MTGLTASPQQAQEMIASLRAWVQRNISPEIAQDLRILYGGSVTADNAQVHTRIPNMSQFYSKDVAISPDIKITPGPVFHAGH